MGVSAEIAGEEPLRCRDLSGAWGIGTEAQNVI